MLLYCVILCPQLLFKKYIPLTQSSPLSHKSTENINDIINVNYGQSHTQYKMRKVKNNMAHIKYGKVSTQYKVKRKSSAEK